MAWMMMPGMPLDPNRNRGRDDWDHDDPDGYPLVAALIVVIVACVIVTVGFVAILVS